MAAIFILLFFLKLVAREVAAGAAGGGEQECIPTRCYNHHGGPAIRFPFRLKDHHPDHCGYPGFDLACSENTTMLELPFSSSSSAGVVKLAVRKIDYKSQLIHTYDPHGCFPRQLRILFLFPYLSTTSSPFQLPTAGRSSSSGSG